MRTTGPGYLVHLFAIAVALTINVAGAQPAPAPGVAPLPPPGNWGDEITLSNTIARWLTNPNGEVDGMLLADGTQATFPPHLSARLVQSMKPADRVELSGWREGPVLRARQIRNASTGQTVTDTGPEAPPLPRDLAALEGLTASGRIEVLLHGPRGEVNGAVLQGGDIVRFPPPVGLAFQALLQPGQPLHARGFGTRNGLGTALEATALGPSASDVRQIFAGPPISRPM